jgi:hypothetical protein
VNTYSGEFVAAWCALGGLVALLICAWIQRIRDRHAAREAAKRARFDAIARMGFRSALMRGLVDERGNPISRVGFPEDVQ